MAKERTAFCCTRWAVMICLGAALALGASQTARADGYRDDDHHRYDPRYDDNHDGLLDHSERDVSAFDHDGDGYLDWRERRALRRHQRAMRQRSGRTYRNEDRARYSHRYDRDRDRRLDRRERRVARRVERLFRRYDRDRDGALEWHEVRRTRLSRRLYHMDRDGDGRANWSEVERFVREGDRSRYRHDDGYWRRR